MTKPVVLITSATSKNGTAAAKLLLDTGKYTVRLGCRDPAKLDQALLDRGAEAVELTASPESAVAALQGVSYLYIILPTLRAGPQTPVLESYLQSGSSLEHVIYLSDLNVNCADHFAPVHDHYKHQELALRAGIPCTILQPAFFHENTVTYHASSIAHKGAFFTCGGDGVWTSVAVQDIAAAVVAILEDRGAHAGRVYRLQAEALTDATLAEKVSRASGKPVRHVNCTPEEYVGLLRMMFGEGVEDSFMNGILRLDEAKRESRFAEVSGDLERIVGRKGVSVDAFLAGHAAAFSTAA